MKGKAEKALTDIFDARSARTLYNRIIRGYTSASYYETSREKMIYVIAKK